MVAGLHLMELYPNDSWDFVQTYLGVFNDRRESWDGDVWACEEYITWWRSSSFEASFVVGPLKFVAVWLKVTIINSTRSYNV